MAASTPNKSGPKSAKNGKKIVILRLKPELLSRFAEPSSSKASSKASSPPKTESMSVSTPLIKTPAADELPETKPSPGPDEDTPKPDPDSLAPPQAGGKKKGVPGPKPGSKRAAPGGDQQAKPRGKPGPKKKPRLADGTIDRSAETTKKGPFAGVAPISSHKLGPKANMGIVNAGLRALDRSGKPCRRWERKGFELKSISGVSWTVGSWGAPPKDASSTFSGDVKSETSGSSDVAKAQMESSAVQSERSNSGADAEAARPSNGVASSPAPAIAAGA